MRFIKEIGALTLIGVSIGLSGCGKEYHRIKGEPSYVTDPSNITLNLSKSGGKLNKTYIFPDGNNKDTVTATENGPHDIRISTSHGAVPLEINKVLYDVNNVSHVQGIPLFRNLGADSSVDTSVTFDIHVRDASAFYKLPTSKTG